jgi:hypothetical protein
MIDAHKIGPPTTKDPFEESIDQQVDWPSRYTLTQLDKIAESLDRIDKFASRSREKEAPTLVIASSGVGATGTNSNLVATTTLLVVGIIFAVNGSTTWTFHIGGINYVFHSAQSITYVPFPIKIAVGTDFGIINASDNVECYVIAYTA